MNRQMTLAEMNDEFGAARTNKKEFLNKMRFLIVVRLLSFAVSILLMKYPTEIQSDVSEIC